MKLKELVYPEDVPNQQLMSFPTELSGLADLAQIAALIFAVFVFAIAAYTLYKVVAQLKEMVNAQRAQSGPLISISFSESSEPNWFLMDDSGLIDISSNSIGFLPRPNYNSKASIVGVPRKRDESRSQTVQVLNCRIKNVQTAPTGIARDIKIEVIGSWWVETETGDYSQGFIHVFSNSFSLNPGETKVAELVSIEDVDYYVLYINKLSYKDLWNHEGKAFIGAAGGHHSFRLNNPRTFRPYDSVTPDDENPNLFRLERWMGWEWTKEDLSVFRIYLAKKLSPVRTAWKHLARLTSHK